VTEKPWGERSKNDAVLATIDHIRVEDRMDTRPVGKAGPTSSGLRILHLYSGNLYGGIERLLSTFARERHLSPGIEPAFGLCFRGQLSDELLTVRVPVIDLGPVRFSRPWTLWRARMRLGRLLRQERFDVVMTHAAWPHAAFARTVQAAELPLAHWVHNVMTGHRFEKRAARVLPGLIVANSRFTADSVPNVFPGVRTEVIYCPVSAPTASSALRAAVRAELNTPADDVVIIQASRLERLKGHSVLVEALGRLRHRGGWTAWIAGGPQKVGEAEYLAELRRRAGALGIEGRVRFLGQRRDVARLLGGADVLCQPNTGPESFGIAFVEALYAGRPVVTVDVGGGREIIDSRCGVLVPPNDSGAVAAALAELIADPVRRSALSAAAPARAAELCDPHRQLGRLAELLRCICQ
jgi:glycosyltransferase involved in cell wall biosynthesis